MAAKIYVNQMTPVSSKFIVKSKQFAAWTVALFLLATVNIFFSTPAVASTTTWENVNVSSAPFVDTLADGTTVSITFGPQARYFSSSYAPTFYATGATGPITNSTIRFTFDRPVTSLKTFYGFVGWGDQEQFTTNLGPVNLAQTVAQGGNLVSSTGNLFANQPAGTYSSTGIVSATSQSYLVDANSATLELYFPSGITYLEVRGAPDSTAQPNGLAGDNLIGLALPMTTFDINFDANGGVGTMPTESIYNSSVLPQNTFTRNSYVFTGWNTQANGSGTAYANGATIPAADVTLYAQWQSTASSFTVGFNANGGSGVMANQTISAASQLPQNTFTRTGYEFTGWNTQANGSGTAYANGATIPAANVTLYAQWRSTELPQTGFNPNGIGLTSISLLGFGFVFLLLSRFTRIRKVLR